MPAVRIFTIVSLDGCVADASGAIDWLNAFDPRKYGFDAFQAGVSAVVMGRSTFEQITTFGDAWPHEGKKTVVLSSRKLDRLPAGAVHERAGIRAAVAAARDGASGDVWIVGGSVTMRSAIDAGLVDRIDLFVAPVLLGAGMPLFGELKRRVSLNFDNLQIHRDGVLHLSYAPANTAP